jgi:hypothetical protein
MLIYRKSRRFIEKNSYIIGFEASSFFVICRVTPLGCAYPEGRSPPLKAVVTSVRISLLNFPISPVG